MDIENSTVVQISKMEHERDSLLRIFNILENAYGDLHNYIDLIEDLRLEDVINDMSYKILVESLAQFSTAFADLSSTIEAVKRSMKLN